MSSLGFVLDTELSSTDGATTVEGRAAFSSRG